MKPSVQNVFVFALLLLVAPALKAELVSEATVSSGYQGNLFNDSSSTTDKYASIGMNLHYYPSPSTKLTAGAQYNTFSDHSDLSNISGDLSVTIIPTRESSKITLALSGNLSTHKFGTLYELYDQISTGIGANAGYHLFSWVYLQSSAFYTNNSYLNTDFGANRDFNIASGINLALPGSNSFAFKVDFSHQSFDQPPDLIESTEPGMKPRSQSGENVETFETTSYLFRFSRPLGKRTGFNFATAYRQIQMDNDYTVLGYTIDYLSPWSSLWEGQSFSAGLKHFFPRQITTELSFSYYDKNFVDVIELEESGSEAYWSDSRHDRLTALSLFVSRPISLRSGKQLIPSVYLGYRQNQSSTGFFDYEDILASISVKLSL